MKAFMSEVVTGAGTGPRFFVLAETWRQECGYGHPKHAEAEAQRVLGETEPRPQDECSYRVLWIQSCGMGAASLAEALAAFVEG